MRVRVLGWLALPASMALYPAGCTTVTESSTTTSNDLIGQPIVEIDPAEFIKVTPGLVCGDLPGAMRSYVATFVDLGPLTPDGTPSQGYPIALPSSEPTSCSQRVAFANGVVGHRYVAEIDGYEQAPETLKAACSSAPPYARCIGLGKAPVGAGVCSSDDECFEQGCYGRCLGLPKQEVATDGSGTCQTIIQDGKSIPINVCDYTPVQGDRHMVDAKKFTLVSPRWTSRATEPCGYRTPAAPAAYEKAEIRPCAPLQDSQAATPTATGIRVLPSATLYNLVCSVPMVVSASQLSPASPTSLTPASPSASASVAVPAPPPSTVTVPIFTGFDVLPDQPGLFAKKGVDCASTTGALFEQGVTAGREYTFRVNAYEGGTAPTKTAACFATALSGVIVLAKCDPLVAIP